MERIGEKTECVSKKTKEDKSEVLKKIDLQRDQRYQKITKINAIAGYLINT